MELNEEADILGRLGILDSRLECPNKDFPGQKKKNVAAISASGAEKAGASAKFVARSSARDLEAGDGWSGLSLSEPSSDDEEEEEDSDCLFERKAHISTNALAASRQRLRRLRGGGAGTSRRPRKALNGGGGAAGMPSHWKLVSLLCTAAFLGFSLTLQQHFVPSSTLQLMNGKLDEYAGVNTGQQNQNQLFRMLGLHSVCLFAGSWFAAHTFVRRTNPFAILFAVMLLFLLFCAHLLHQTSTGVGGGTSTTIFVAFCALQAFMAGTVERGILLLCPLWTAGRHRRVLFLAYATVSLGAGASFFLQQQAQQQELGQNPKNAFQLGQNFAQNFAAASAATQRRDRRELLLSDGSGNNHEHPMINNSFNDTVGTAVPSFLQLELANPDNSNANNPANNDAAVPVNDNANFNLTLMQPQSGEGNAGNGSISSNGTASQPATLPPVNADAKKPFEEGSAGQGQEEQPVFKTKTEENAFRRKEVEVKKQQKLRAATATTAGQAGTTTTASSTTTTSTTTTPLPTTTIPTTTTTTTTSSSSTAAATTTAKRESSTIGTGTAVNDQQKQQQQQMIKEHQNQTAVPSGGMAQLPLMLPPPQFIAMCALLIPLVLGFCCCCALDHPVCSSQYAHLAELLSPASAHAEPFSCSLLSFLSWTLHHSLAAVILATVLPVDGVGGVGPLGGLPPVALFWFLVTVGRLVLAIWPRLAVNTALVHAAYFLLILACSMLHFFLPSTMFTHTASLAILAFSSTLPLVLYAWYCDQSRCAPLNASARFIASLAISHFAGPLAFSWWTFGGDADQMGGKVSRDANPSSSSSSSSSSTPLSSLPLFCLVTMSLGYALFLLLLAKLRRAQRQKQISHLSGELNGKAHSKRSTKHRKGRGATTTTKNGQYSLLAKAMKSKNGKPSSSSTAEFPSLMLLDSSSATNSTDDDEDGVELEMESIGEPEQQDQQHQPLEQREEMDRKKKNSSDGKKKQNRKKGLGGGKLVALQSSEEEEESSLEEDLI